LWTAPSSYGSFSRSKRRFGRLLLLRLLLLRHVPRTTTTRAILLHAYNNQPRGFYIVVSLYVCAFSVDLLLRHRLSLACIVTFSLTGRKIRRVASSCLSSFVANRSDNESTMAFFAAPIAAITLVASWAVYTCRSFRCGLRSTQ
jgi:hypothetical protein